MKRFFAAIRRFFLPPADASTFARLLPLMAVVILVIILFMPTTPLFDRLKREGRLFEDSWATNFSPPNFRTVLPAPVLLRGLRDLLIRLYEPEPFFRRAVRSLESWRPSATQRPPRIEGTWALAGWEPGKGALYGRVTIGSVSGTADEFSTEISYVYARTGQRVTRAGRAVVYTGFQWRGRSTVGADEATSLREVMFLDPDSRRIEVRWFTGGYDELGMDVRLERVGLEPLVLGTSRTALSKNSARYDPSWPVMPVMMAVGMQASIR